MPNIDRGALRIPVKIVHLLKSFPNTTLTRTFIFERCWGRPYMPIDENTFYANMTYARRMLDEGRIVNGYGKGYKWVCS